MDVTDEHTQGGPCTQLSAYHTFFYSYFHITYLGIVEMQNQWSLDHKTV